MKSFVRRLTIFDVLFAGIVVLVGASLAHAAFTDSPSPGEAPVWWHASPATVVDAGSHVAEGASQAHQALTRAPSPPSAYAAGHAALPERPPVEAQAAAAELPAAEEAPHGAADRAPPPERVDPYYTAALPPATAAPPPILGRSFAIIEPTCRAMLWGHNEHMHLAPASVTKIVTAMVVTKHADLDEMVQVTVSGSAMRNRGSSVMGIEPGMVISVRDLLYGLMLPSGNDAALALAQHVGGGDVGRFVQMMNEEVRSLGLNETSFANPHGLDALGHYSTAMDMALLGAEMMEIPIMAEISLAPNYKGDWPGPLMNNGNRLLSSYPGTYGVKIGFTRDAKQTIVAGVERDGRKVMVSVFGSDDRYADASKLLDWAFANTSRVCHEG